MPRVWHKHNVELLRALRETQLQQGATLEGHSRQLAEHSRLLAELERRLAEHERQLTEHSRLLTEQGRLLTEHGRQLGAIEGELGTITLGVHDTQLMLRHLIEREGGAEAGPTTS